MSDDKDQLKAGPLLELLKLFERPAWCFALAVAGGALVLFQELNQPNRSAATYIIPLGLLVLGLAFLVAAVAGWAAGAVQKRVRAGEAGKAVLEANANEAGVFIKAVHSGSPHLWEKPGPTINWMVQKGLLVETGYATDGGSSYKIPDHVWEMVKARWGYLSAHGNTGAGDLPR